MKILSEDRRKQLLDASGGVCCICEGNRTKRALVVDHDHKSGKIRGLLCGSCNSAIGMLGDDAGLVTRALKYLEIHAGE